MIQLLVFITHLHLSGVWVGVDLRANTKKTYISKRLKSRHMLQIINYYGTILDSTNNIQ